MAFSYDVKTSDGETPVYSFRFVGVGKGYIKDSDVVVEVRPNGTIDWNPTNMFVLETSNSIRFTGTIPPAPDDDKPNIRIRRVMPKDHTYADWNTGQNYTDYLINNSFLQQLYTMHEALDGFMPLQSVDLDMQGHSLVNLAIDPNNPDSIATMGQLTEVLAKTRELVSTLDDKVAQQIAAIIAEGDKQVRRVIDAGGGGSMTGDPDPDDSVDLRAGNVWLADTSLNARTRKLPAAGSKIPIGARIVVRDSSGYSSQNNITLERNGNLIEGRQADLILATDWAWCELIYIGGNKYEISSGGVGAEVRLNTDAILDKVYFVGCVIMTKSAVNPASTLGVGVWERAALGRALFGIGQSTGDDGRLLDVTATPQGVVATRLTEQHIPYHTHELQKGNFGSTLVQTGFGTSVVGGGRNTTGGWGSRSPELINNVPPLQGYYVWERVR